MHKVFHSLQDVDLPEADLTKKLPLGPEEVRHGTFANGLTYYVLKCAKPPKRVAISLAVKVGSVLEEEHEQGIAHILEHLAFNATEEYSNHQLVAFLEKIGAQFGACQNAHTTPDETVYFLVVPSDDWQNVERSFSVLAQWAFHIRCAPQDLEKERGAVLEEWRMTRNARGRAADAHWKLITKGSRYEERLPIGKESVIKGVSADVIKAFYKRWYRPENMAVVVVGDFSDPDEVVTSLKQYMEPASSPSDTPAPPIPSFPFMPHTQPRYQVFSDKEAQEASVYVSFKHQRTPTSTPAEYMELMKDQMFQIVMQGRFNKLSRQEQPPFIAAGAQTDPICATTSSSILSASCYEGTTLGALEVLLTEVARVRLHGVSDRELQRARTEMASEVESVYVERDQSYCHELRDEYVRHFLNDEFVTGREYEARLAKTLLPKITADHMRQRATRYQPSCSCVVKTVQHKSRHTEDELAAVVDRVQAAEQAGSIPPWQQDDVPDSLMTQLPEPGEVVGTQSFSELGSTELSLSNGMKVVLKTTSFLDDEVLVSGYAAGGLSEVSKERFKSLSCCSSLALYLGPYGLKPHIVEEVLAGRRVSLNFGERAYRKALQGEASPDDVETLFQLIHLLFTHRVHPDPQDVQTARRALKQSLLAARRDPAYQWGLRVQQVNYGSCYFFEPLTVHEVDRIDAEAACAHHNQVFSNPAEFKIVIVGNITQEALQPLVCRYLASIPLPQNPPPSIDPAKITPLLANFPEHPVIEEIRAPMVAPMTQTQISFPLEVARPVAREEQVWLMLCCRLLETKLVQKMRFEIGEIYTVSVGPYFGCAAPSATVVKGDVAITFSCDPANRHELMELVLDELDRLQTVGPSQGDIDTVINLEQRTFENSQQENSYWLETIENAYQSWTFRNDAGGDLDKVFTLSLEARTKVLSEALPETVAEAFRRLFPCPCRTRYTAFTLVPQPTVAQQLQLLLATLATSPRARWYAALATGSALGLLAFAAIKVLRRR